MKKVVIKLILKICKVDQTTLIDIHDEAIYGKAYITYIERYRKYVYGFDLYPCDVISTDWYDSPTLQRLKTIEKTKALLNE